MFFVEVYVFDNFPGIFSYWQGIPFHRPVRIVRFGTYMTVDNVFCLLPPVSVMCCFMLWMKIT